MIYSFDEFKTFNFYCGITSYEIVDLYEIIDSELVESTIKVRLKLFPIREVEIEPKVSKL